MCSWALPCPYSKNGSVDVNSEPCHRGIFRDIDIVFKRRVYCYMVVSFQCCIVARRYCCPCQQHVWPQYNKSLRRAVAKPHISWQGPGHISPSITAMAPSLAAYLAGYYWKHCGAKQDTENILRSNLKRHTIIWQFKARDQGHKNHEPCPSTSPTGFFISFLSSLKVHYLLFRSSNSSNPSSWYHHLRSLAPPAQ